MEVLDKFQFGRNWRDLESQQIFLRSLAKKLKYKKMEDWYKVSQSDILKNGGVGLLRKYKNNISEMLTAVYPDHEWLPWKFDALPRRFFKSPANLTTFFKYLEKALNIKDPSDWYRVSLNQIQLFGKIRFMHYTGSLYNALKTVYPNQKWDKSKLSSKSSKKASQRWLKIQLTKLFPGIDIIESFNPPHLRYDDTSTAVELDIFIPSYNLAIEYQGEQHYENITGLTPFGARMIKDVEKARLCKQNGYTLVLIPYWWNGSAESLASTINKKDPNIPVNERYLHLSPPIPEHPPTRAKEPESPVVYENYFMLGVDWQHDMDPTNWWMSEKYDGVRALWNGKEFYSRNGRVLSSVPKSFKSGLPNVYLDGELWTQYGKFHEVSSLLFRNSTKIDIWKSVKFMVFDLPDKGNEPYEQRITALISMEDDLPSHVKIVQTIQCKGKDDLMEFFNNIINSGGEGVMLREPNSPYEHARSSCMRKMKWFFETEVKFVGISNGQLVCEEANGGACAVQCANEILLDPPPEGSVLTIKHLGRHGNGPLRRATYHGVRHDLTWRAVLDSQNQQEFIE